MVDISAALTSIKTISGVVLAGGKIDLTQHVIELQQTLLNLQAENGELSSANRDLKKKVDELLGLLELREGFVFEGNAYWRGEGAKREGPFCSRCFDADRKVIRLIQHREGFGACNNCDKTVRLEGPVPRQERSVSARPGWVNSWRND